MTKWTKEPPKEPGWYWVRRTDSESDEMAFLVLALPQVNETHSIEIGEGTMDLSDRLGCHVEWFPIPITPPSEERT